MGLFDRAPDGRILDPLDEYVARAKMTDMKTLPAAPAYEYSNLSDPPSSSRDSASDACQSTSLCQSCCRIENEAPPSACTDWLPRACTY